MDGSRGELGRRSFLRCFPGVGVFDAHCSHVTVFSGFHTVHHAHPVGGIVVFCFGQEHHIP
ncbi:MAG: hypothetical protein ACK559_39890, partial [bacterium]